VGDKVLRSARVESAGHDSVGYDRGLRRANIPTRPADQMWASL